MDNLPTPLRSSTRPRSRSPVQPDTAEDAGSDVGIGGNSIIICEQCDRRYELRVCCVCEVCHGSVVYMQCGHVVCPTCYVKLGVTLDPRGMPVITLTSCGHTECPMCFLEIYSNQKRGVASQCRVCKEQATDTRVCFTKAYTSEVS